MDRQSQDPFDRTARSGGTVAVSHEEFSVQSQTALVRFLREGVQPPSVVYMGIDDQIQIFVSEALTPKTLNVQGRWLRAADGLIVPFQQAVAPTVAGGTALFTFRLGEGFLLSLTITNPSANISESSDFALAALSRTGGLFGQAGQTLCAGHVGANKGTSFPLGGIVRPLDGPGYIRSITGTTPALGADISETVPSGARWELLAFQGALTASAVVANRQPWFVIDDGVNLLKRSLSTQATVASTTSTYYADNPGIAPQASTQSALWSTILPIMLAPGFRIRTITSAIDVGDQWTSPKYLVRQWTDLE
jgi:hypothetical protein